MFYLLEDPNDLRYPFVGVGVKNGYITQRTIWGDNAEKCLDVPMVLYAPKEEPPLNVWIPKYQVVVEAETIEELKLLNLMEN